MPFAGILLAALPVKEYARLYRYFTLEPWGNVGIGHAIGRLARATVPGAVPEDFVVAAPTPAEQKAREEYEAQRAEFEAWRAS